MYVKHTGERKAESTYTALHCLWLAFYAPTHAHLLFFALYTPSVPLFSPSFLLCISLSVLSNDDLYLSTCQTTKCIIHFLPFFRALFKWGHIEERKHKSTFCTHIEYVQSMRRQQKLLPFAILPFFSVWFGCSTANATMETVKYLSKLLAPTHELFRLCVSFITFIIIYCERKEFAYMSVRASE